jgi:hypothetical protein
MTTVDLSHAQAIIDRLAEIDQDLATRMPVLESAAKNWFKAKRDKEKQHAQAFLSAEGTVAERQAHASLVTSVVGMEAEAEYEALKAVVRVLEARASIGQSLLRAERA